ncbi:MAG: DNA polymerase III subunit epsilon [Geminicoccaceae bacterium]|nr:DNA polymerase III subunit epsilon [Geminicoccaceae bacterium]MCS7266545.1 DNA polymerase III subunit epsilon [Geminicoccaceae bacterium]MCX7628972.1 DNA polymerase III subunit epsilon [Geminicoccaceae bacterium]MDW8125632.1 DNA polymerase III subunit epsilon [Geminicoccaceae bacterium]MDW8340078.1 DNA polymerase III subunit epsilon [Geminicoccaceae bacterium]
MLREVVLDTETTGLDPAEGHRIVEIAALELVNHLPTGETFQTYLDPERDVPEEARRVHGLDRAFLTGQPTFAQVVDRLLAFLGESPLVIHNAAFDLAFLNAELARVGRPPIAASRVIDTLLLAQSRFPGAPVNLDALCRRFGVDASARTLHGALLDCRLLAEVYVHLLGGRQAGLALVAGETPRAAPRAVSSEPRAPRPPRPHAPSAEELAAHRAFVAQLVDPIWNR